MNLFQQPLLIGAWIGLIHAFDADHLSTLSSLAVRDRQRSALAYAMRWACGHAVAIGALGSLALGLGMLWIAGLSRFAEILVAILLVTLGLNTIATRLRLPADRPADGRPADGPAGGPPGAGHADFGRGRALAAVGPAAGLGMGLLHGGAGSAAVLAILPLAAFDSNFAALSFLVSFSFGVAAGALLFAVCFARFVARAAACGEQVARLVSVVIGAVAVVVGASLLLGSLGGG